MNIVLDDAKDVMNGAKPMGMIVVRGNSVLAIEPLVAVQSSRR